MRCAFEFLLRVCQGEIQAENPMCVKPIIHSSNYKYKLTVSLLKVLHVSMYLRDCKHIEWEEMAHAAFRPSKSQAFFMLSLESTFTGATQENPV